MGYTGKRTILGDYLHSHRPHPLPLPEWRYETKPGVQLQVDWADCWYTLSTGIIRKVSCFTMILGYSRMRYVEFTRSTDLVTFLLCLQKAFEYFGGVTEQILFDNIKTVVLKRKYPSSQSDFYPSLWTSVTITDSKPGYADHSVPRQKQKLNELSIFSSITFSMERHSTPLKISTGRRFNGSRK
jgi:transposase